MRVFILSALLCAAHAFQTPMPLTRRLALSPLASTPETTPTPTTPPISMTPVPDMSVVQLDEEDDVAIDYEALSQESASQAFMPKTDISDMYVKKERFAPRQAKWFPMLLSPAALDGSYAGDVGFDPLGFAKDEESFLRMREAELKHARLAMLAAAGWPLSELWHQGIAQVLGLDSILADADRAPSVLNGGLMNEWIVGTGVAALVVGALLEFKGFQSKGKRAGDLGFDPLSLHKFRASFGLDPITEQITAEEKMRRAKFDMELAEIKNGRLAMIAITGYAAQEWVTGIPVVQQTPFFFGDPIL